jgi:hypothetical protein
MSLKDMSQETMYPRLGRFLDSNCGKRWDSVYHKICSAAAANTLHGQRLRRDLRWYVDPYPGGHNDYFVDDNGILRKAKSINWKARRRERMKKEPIILVRSADPNIWYELIDIPDGPRASCYTKFHKAWFQFTRIYIKDSYPIYEYHGNVQGKQIGAKPINREEIHKRQCGAKEVKAILAVVKQMKGVVHG